MSSMLLLYQAADIDGYLVSDEMTLSPLAVERAIRSPAA